MSKSLRRCLAYGIACILLGIGIGIAVMVLQNRTGAVGGEFLVLAAIPAAVYAGMVLGARLVTWAPAEKRTKVWTPYWK